MLSRFSSLFVYVVAGLVISAAATPMGPPRDYDDGSKVPMPQGSSSYSPSTTSKYPAESSYYAKPYSEKKYPEEMPYPKPYPEEKYPEEVPYPRPQNAEEMPYPMPYPEDKKPYPEDKKPYPEDKKPYPEDKKPYPEDKKPYPADRKPYPEDKKPYPEQKKPYSEDPSYSKPGDKGKSGSYNDPNGNTGACSVGPQQCCNQVIASQDSEVPSFLGGLDLEDLEDILAIIGAADSDSLVGRDCSPRDGNSAGCNAQPMCCTNNSFNGLVAIGCSIVDFDVDLTR
ncbi:hypothetical protein BJV78DRAFT_1280749 [Lactifluus subvellereus]|nr:hypothetical protein BJV78DRAFT_1280749 [Lactifluus subvellereus]